MKYRIHKPKHIDKKYSSAILFKICPTWERLLDFVNGKLYMNTSNFFSKLESISELTNGQYDYLESVDLLLNETEEYELFMDYSQNIPHVVQGKRGTVKCDGPSIVSAQFASKRVYNIYCMYSMWMGQNNKMITSFDDRVEKAFGKYFVIILNKSEFIRRVEEAVKKLPYKLKSDLDYGFVNYFNTRLYPRIELGPFKKDIKYEYQNEFRILLEIDREPAPLIYFEIGDLSDIVLVGQTKVLKDIKLSEKGIIINDIQIPVIWENE